MYEVILNQIGLNENQAHVYEILLRLGPSTARKVSEHSPLKRPLTYKVLDELEAMRLVQKHEEQNKIAVFEPQHPSKLQDIIDGHIQKDLQARDQLEAVMGSLVSDFNLVSGKPGVRFYEGPEGIKAVTYDSLSTKGEIYTYVDSEEVDRYAADLDLDYVHKRKKLGIKKKILAPDSASIREIHKKSEAEITEIRVLPRDRRFTSAVQIYDDKISYITLGEKVMIGVIIQDKAIADMHRQLFLHTWTQATSLDRVR